MLYSEMLEIRHPRFVDSDDLWLGFFPPPVSFDSTSQIKIGFGFATSYQEIATAKNHAKGFQF